MADNATTSIVNPSIVNTGTVNVPAETPKDNGIRSWSVNGKQTRVQTGTIKTGKSKGQPHFRFIFHPEEPSTNPTWADVTSLVATLDVADQLAIVVNKEVLRELAHEISLRITETTPEGVKSLNVAKIGAIAKEVVMTYLADKDTAKKLAEEIAELSAEYQTLANEVLAAALQGRKVNEEPELKAKANRIGNLSLQIQEKNTKLANASRKKAAPAAAPAAAKPAVAAVPAAK